MRGGHVPPGIRMPLLPRYVSSSSYDIHASSSPYDMVMIETLTRLPVMQRGVSIPSPPTTAPLYA